MHDASTILPVTKAEQGMKLISFLSRRFDGQARQSELHRWIRTGQVRVNGGRAKAFDRLAQDDMVRVPPFAVPLARRDAEDRAPLNPGADLGRGLILLAEAEDILVLEKPAGLPVQPGTGHMESAATVLARRFAGAAYVPAPAHRLDKDTSGLLLAGTSHQGQEALHALFAAGCAPSGTGMEKTYLAWVSGDWPYEGETALSDFLGKDAERTGTGGFYETVRATRDAPTPGDGYKPARCRVTPLFRVGNAPGPATLLRVDLETGRTHQIRVQLSSRGFPVIGDAKYKGRPFPRMLLHACRLGFAWGGERLVFVSRPEWPTPFAVPDRLDL